MKTWQAEALVVSFVLVGVALLGGGGLLQWTSATAVFFSFMHAQVADRLAEQQASLARPEVYCVRWARRYFLVKEMLWCAFFVMAGSWPALAGVAVFLAYPAWRAAWRSRFPRASSGWSRP